MVDFRLIAPLAALLLASTANAADVGDNRIDVVAGMDQDWLYSFVATGQGISRMDSSVATSGTSYFDRGNQVVATAARLDRTGSDLFDPTARKPAEIPLIANDFYNLHFGVASDPRPMSPAPADSNREILDATMPRLATWALLIGGFLLIGGLLRRRARSFARA